MFNKTNILKEFMRRQDDSNDQLIFFSLLEILRDYACIHADYNLLLYQCHKRLSKSIMQMFKYEVKLFVLKKYIAHNNKRLLDIEHSIKNLRALHPWGGSLTQNASRKQAYGLAPMIWLS